MSWRGQKINGLGEYTPNNLPDRRSIGFHLADKEKNLHLLGAVLSNFFLPSSWQQSPNLFTVTELWNQKSKYLQSRDLFLESLIFIYQFLNRTLTLYRQKVTTQSRWQRNNVPWLSPLLLLSREEAPPLPFAGFRSQQGEPLRPWYSLESFPQKQRNI